MPWHRPLLILFAAAMLLAAASGHAQGVFPGAANDYQARLAQYTQARAAYDEVASAYWDQIADKRRGRNDKRRTNTPIGIDDYVLTQPPIYTGRPRPVDPNAPPGPPPGEKAPLPVIADFLKAAAEQFGFVPDRPQSELDFKRAYAKAASAAGLTKDQIVGVYAFETGGNGTYDMQAGVSATRTNAISPAIGYNQLLSTNTVSILAEHGNQLIALLRQKTKTLTGPEKIAFDRKIEAFKHMIALSRSVPQRWGDFDIMAKTTAGGWGIHAAILDRDIGPQLQVQKIATSLHFSRMKHYNEPLTAAELELMNLTGDSTGLDMIMMPPDLRARVPTSNFFQQNGYDRNPVARRTAVVGGLIADIENKMKNGAQSQGAKDLASAF